MLQFARNCVSLWVMRHFCIGKMIANDIHTQSLSRCGLGLREAIKGWRTVYFVGFEYSFRRTKSIRLIVDECLLSFAAIVQNDQKERIFFRQFLIHISRLAAAISAVLSSNKAEVASLDRELYDGKCLKRPESESRVKKTNSSSGRCDIRTAHSVIRRCRCIKLVFSCLIPGNKQMPFSVMRSRLLDGRPLGEQECWIPIWDSCLCMSIPVLTLNFVHVNMREIDDGCE